jgi:cystathionine gamma-synthase
MSDPEASKPYSSTPAVRSAGEPYRGIGRPLAQPIYQTTVYAFDSLEAAKTADSEGDWFYYRVKGINQTSFEKGIAELEAAEAACACGSGMAAIFNALTVVLSSGDHVLVDGQVYGGTYALLVDQLPKFGISHTFVDMTDYAAVKAAIQPNTKALYFETVTNPLIRVTDLNYMAQLAKEFGLVSMVDATFTTPCVVRPIEYGIDVVLHATTKYIGGHSDALGGLIVGNNDFITQARTQAKLMGLTQSPFDAWLNVRSLKTLPLRMEAHSRNALVVAQWLEKHPKISKVNYPGLESHPQHKLALRQMPNGCGGMLSFDLDGGEAAVSQFIAKLKDIPFAPSLADVITTVSHPANTSHKMLPREDRLALGIGDGLVRLSVGIEDVADIINDLKTALD